MDPRIAPIVAALDDCAGQMRAHADWMEHLLRRTYQLWATPGEFESNMTAVVAIRHNATTMQKRVETIERTMLEPGDHSQRCLGTGCAEWCRFREPLPLVARAVPPTPPKPPEPELLMPDRFKLIDLDD